MVVEMGPGDIKAPYWMSPVWREFWEYMLAVSKYWYNPAQDWNDWKELATNFDENDHGIMLDRDSELLTSAIWLPRLHQLFLSLSIPVSIFLVDELNLFYGPLPRSMVYVSGLYRGLRPPQILQWEQEEKYLSMSV